MPSLTDKHGNSVTSRKWFSAHLIAWEQHKAGLCLAAYADWQEALAHARLWESQPGYTDAHRLWLKYEALCRD